MKKQYDTKIDYLLIGGGIASAVAAEALRKEGIDGSVAILAEENHLPYYRAQLGRYRDEQLLVLNEEDYHEKQIDVYLNTKALQVNPTNNLVTTDQLGVIKYKKLLIATGGRPIKLDYPGVELQGIFYLRTLDDFQIILNKIEKSKHAAIVGGSHIAIELASALIKLGLSVTNIANEFNFFDKNLTEAIAQYLTERKINVIIREHVKCFKGNQHVEAVITSSGQEIKCDFVVVVVGFKPNVEFLDGSGIAINNGIVVDQYMQTNFKDIFSAGDVANFYDPIYQRYHRIESWDNAVKQGKIAGRNMAGLRQCYRTVSYLFFHAFGDPLVFLGDTSDAQEVIIRGSVEEKTFAALYLKYDKLIAAFFLGRPIAEIKAAEGLIVNRIDLKKYKNDITDINFSLEELSAQTLITLQGGGALGAFECGVIKAMQEKNIRPDIVAGISIGAFNAAIIASNPNCAAEALESFWNELILQTPEIIDEETRRYLSSLHTIIWGSPKFFRPRWLLQWVDPSELSMTSFYDTKPIMSLLTKYVDFNNLNNSPIRLLIMAVNVETAEFEVFDSYTDKITVKHVVASGSLPPGFPWMEIDGKYYWDGGIVSNTPLDAALEICGTTSKHVYVVDLYPKKKSLPKNMIEVYARKDEILFSEKIRRDMRMRDFLDNYKKILGLTMSFLDQGIADLIRKMPVYIQTVGDPGMLSMTRIVRELSSNELDSRDSDFSAKTIEELKVKGYLACKRALAKQSRKFKVTKPLDKKAPK